jgi:hypothetical protein
MTSPTQDAEFIRKVALGILSTLQHKGLLSSIEVDAILRAAMPKPAPPLEVKPTAPMPTPDASKIRKEPLPPVEFDMEL